MQHSSWHFIVAGDLSQYLIHRFFDYFLNTFILENHVDFPTHMSGTSLDPVVSDLSKYKVKCRPLWFVGFSDHWVVLTDMYMIAERAEEFTSTTWLWDCVKWTSLKDDIALIQSNDLKAGPVTNRRDLLLATYLIFNISISLIGISMLEILTIHGSTIVAKKQQMPSIIPRSSTKDIPHPGYCNNIMKLPETKKKFNTALFKTMGKI